MVLPVEGRRATASDGVNHPRRGPVRHNAWCSSSIDAQNRLLGEREHRRICLNVAGKAMRRVEVVSTLRSSGGNVISSLHPVLALRRMESTIGAKIYAQIVQQGGAAASPPVCEHLRQREPPGLLAPMSLHRADNARAQISY